MCVSTSSSKQTSTNTLVSNKSSRNPEIHLAKGRVVTAHKQTKDNHGVLRINSKSEYVQLFKVPKEETGKCPACL